MRIQCGLLVVVALVGLLAGGLSASAALVGVEYYDIKLGNSGNSGIIGGPLWRGFIDTTADTVTINYWSEIPGSTNFLIPGVITNGGSVTWPAISLAGLTSDSSGNLQGNTYVPYDIPDNFELQGSTGSPGQPLIGQDFAFVSPVDFVHASWEWQSYDTSSQEYSDYVTYLVHPGQFSSPPAFPGTIPVAIDPVLAFQFPGWGGARLTGVNGSELFHFVTNRVQVPSGTTVITRLATEADMPRLLSSSVATSASTDATITEIEVPTGTPTGGNAVPEASQLLCGMAAAFGALVAGNRRRASSRLV